MKKSAVLLLTFAISIQFLAAQDSVPLLKGSINISIHHGTFVCDLELQHVPRINDYYIRLNSGMNIRYFKNMDANTLIYFDKSAYDTLSTGESNAYYFPANGGKGKFLPQNIRFRYEGMFPAIRDTAKDFSVQDWKGNIAFNGYSVRTDGAQTNWYPVLYDIKKDLRIDKYRYDLEIICTDCSTIYLNGNLPVNGTVAHLKSDVPQELTMYCGTYKTVNIGGTYFLNPDITEQQCAAFGQMTNSFKKYYEENLHISYQGPITYIQTTPVSKNNAWMFATYPTIVNIGFGQYGMKSFFDKKTGDWFKPYIAHELGHYYFGTYKRFNAALGDMLSEGFAEFLSLKVAEKLLGDSIYLNKIKQKKRNLAEFKPVAFAEVHSEDDYHNRELYVYNYAPVIFLAIQKEIGEARMWEWMRAVLQTKTDFTDFAFLKSTLESVLKDKTKSTQINEKYFSGSNTLENALLKL